MKRHLFVYLLLVSIGFRAMGWVAISSLQVREARAAMSTVLRKAGNTRRFLHFSFCTREFTRLCTRRGEFRLDGTLYDVKKAEYRGDSIFVTALADERETRAIKQLSRLFRLERPSSASPRNGLAALALFLWQPFLPGEQAAWTAPAPDSGPSAAFFRYTRWFPETVRAVLSPPPEASC